MSFPPVVCFSHLRWNFVFQRPQHLMTRFAAERPVYFLEEPTFGSAVPLLSVVAAGPVQVLTPQIPDDLPPDTADATLRELLRTFLAREGVDRPLLWFYTPMMVPLADGLAASVVVYDCMDELSAFAGAPPNLSHRERRLLRRADLVFTGGHSLYEAKRRAHPRVYAFPSSVDVPHFARARAPQPECEDQAGLGRPRLGYAGVIDERMDLALVAAVADARPDWHLVLLGPVAKIDPATLPRRPNLHYLGLKAYEDLPRYMAGWDAAMLPFARNDATRYISPTKTPEYLAAGKPVISTSVPDVVRPYGEHGLVRIADTADDFVAAAAAAIAEGRPPAAADRHLATLSWDRTFAAMRTLVNEVAARAAAAPAAAGAAPPAPRAARAGEA
jgi:UDP-galactopyranose mutase